MDDETKLLNEINEDKSTDIDKILESSLNHEGDKEVPIFLMEWLNNGFNASAAYKKLHPNISDSSARVLGSRKLTKVNTPAILTAYGMGYEDFFTRFKEGLEAMKWNEFTGEKVPDHKVRFEYLQVLGRLLHLIKT